MRLEDPAVRFWRKVDKSDPDGCWRWQAGTVRGYGQFGVGGGARVYAHRYSYEMHIGPIPDGLTLDHLCRTTTCVNPAHLEPVTAAENTRRASVGFKGRTACCNGHPITPETSYITSQGWWICRTCRREAGARHDKRRRKG